MRLSLVPLLLLVAQPALAFPFLTQNTVDPYNSGLQSFYNLPEDRYDSFYDNGVRKVFSGGGVIVPISEYNPVTGAGARADIQLAMHSPCAGGQTWNMVLARYEKCGPPPEPFFPAWGDNTNAVTVPIPPLVNRPVTPLLPPIEIILNKPVAPPSAAPIPEPATLTLLGASGLFFAKRRNRKA